MTLWQVFEHVPDPRRLGEALVDRLVPGGRLLLSLPNVESFEAERFGGDWFHLDVPRHLVFPPSRTLRTVFEELGVRHVETVPFSAEYGPFGLMQSVLNRIGKRHNALYHRLKRKQPLAGLRRSRQGRGRRSGWRRSRCSARRACSARPRSPVAGGPARTPRSSNGRPRDGAPVSERIDRLESGLTVGIEEMPWTRTVSIGVYVGVGARDESPEQSGVSHFLEHLLFKGTR